MPVPLFISPDGGIDARVRERDGRVRVEPGSLLWEFHHPRFHTGICIHRLQNQSVPENRDSHSFVWSAQHLFLLPGVRLLICRSPRRLPAPAGLRWSFVEVSLHIRDPRRRQERNTRFSHAASCAGIWVPTNFDLRMLFPSGLSYLMRKSLAAGVMG